MTKIKILDGTYLSTLAKWACPLLIAVLMSGCKGCNLGPVKNAPVTTLEKVFSLAKECGAGTSCDLQELENQFNSLSNTDVINLADKKDGEYNFIHFMAKAKIEPKSSVIFKQFCDRLTTLSPQNLDSHLSQTVNGEKIDQILLNDKRPSDETDENRDKFLVVYFRYKADRINYLKSSTGSFDVVHFNRLIDKFDDSDLPEIANKIENGPLDAWSTWNIANPPEGKISFKKLHDRARATRKPVLCNSLWTKTLANYAHLRALVADMTPGAANSWACAGELDSKLEDIVAQYYANRTGNGAATGEADFRALYAAVTNPQKIRMIDALAQEAFKSGPAIPAKAVNVGALIADINTVGGGNWGLGGATAGAHTQRVVNAVVVVNAPGQPFFKALYIATPLATPAMRATLWDETYNASVAASNPNAIVTVVNEINNVLPGDVWGLNGAAVVHTTEFLEFVVGKIFVNFDAGAFKALYGAIAPEQRDIVRKKLWQLAYTAPLATHYVTALIGDINGPNNWGLGGANAGAHTNELLTAAVTDYHASNNAAAFNALYTAGAPVTGAHQTSMVQALINRINAAPGAQANLAALAADINNANNWGLGGAYAAANTQAIVNAPVVSYFVNRIGHQAGTGNAAFMAAYNPASNAIKRTLVQALAVEAAKVGPGEVIIMLADVALGGGNTWGLGANAAEIKNNTKAIIEAAVGHFYSNAGGGGKGEFINFYAALVGQPNKKLAVSALGIAAAKVGFGAVHNLLGDISVGNTWGLGGGVAATANNTKAVLEGAVGQFVSTQMGNGKTEFKNLFGMVDNNKKMQMIQTLAIAYNKGQTPAAKANSVGFLVTDISATNSWGLGGNAVAIGTNLKTVFNALVAHQYARRTGVLGGGTGEADFKAFLAAFQNHEVELIQGLARAAYKGTAAQKTAQINALLLDIKSPVGAGAWGLADNANALQTKLRIVVFLQEAVNQQFINRKNNSKEDFTVLYNLVQSDEKAVMRDTLVKIAYDNGLETNVQTAIDNVVAIIHEGFFDEVTLKLDNTAQNAFDPFETGKKSTLVWAVLTRAKTDNNGLLTHQLVNNGGNPGGLASAVKSKFTGPNAGLDWQGFLDGVINTDSAGNNGSIMGDLVLPAALWDLNTAGTWLGY